MSILLAVAAFATFGSFLQLQSVDAVSFSDAAAAAYDTAAPRAELEVEGFAQKARRRRVSVTGLMGNEELTTSGSGSSSRGNGSGAVRLVRRQQVPWKTDRLGREFRSAGTEEAELQGKGAQDVLEETDANKEAAEYLQCLSQESLVGAINAKVIPDHAIKASSLSTLCDLNEMQRTRLDALGNCWMPDGNDPNEYLEWDLGGEKIVTMVVIQSRENFPSWVTEYKLKYWQKDANDWTEYPRKLRGNSAWRKKSKSRIDQPFRAVNVRLVPTKWNDAIAMRADLEGCTYVPTTTSTSTSTVATTSTTTLKLTTTKAVVTTTMNTTSVESSCLRRPPLPLLSVLLQLLLW